LLTGFKKERLIMEDKIAVELKGVSKKYTLHHEKPTLVENIFTARSSEEFWALKRINLEIKRGEKVGIIGPNGSGKTTLLEVISGITTPTRGSVITNGKKVSLIELEAGFHAELTGQENIYLNGLLIGMSKKEINSKIKKIISFADVRQFIDAPFYAYSEGMKLRLGFSIVAHTNPDIVILDENMAVGDTSFKVKSHEIILDWIKKRKTIIVVSHLLDFISETCDKVVWLEEGKIFDQGKTKTIIKKYLHKYYNRRGHE